MSGTRPSRARLDIGCPPRFSTTRSALLNASWTNGISVRASSDSAPHDRDPLHRLRRRHGEAVLGIRLFGARRRGDRRQVVGAQADLPDAVHVHPVRLHDAERLRLAGGPRLPAFERARRSPPLCGHAAQIDRHGEIQRRRRPGVAPPLPVEFRERDDDAVAPEDADAERAARRAGRADGGTERQRNGAGHDGPRGVRRHRRGVYSRLWRKEGA